MSTKAVPGAKVLRLLPPVAGRAYSQRILDAAKDLVEGVRTGEITGFAIAVRLARNGDRTFFVDALGEYEDNPTLARGAVASLNDLLGNMVKEQKDRAEGRL